MNLDWKFCSCGRVLVRRVDLHRQLGVLGVSYGILILATGILVTGEQSSVRMAAGDVRLAHNGLLFPILDLTMLTGFFSAAIGYRRKSERIRELPQVNQLQTGQTKRKQPSNSD